MAEGKKNILVNADVQRFKRAVLQARLTRLGVVFPKGADAETLRRYLTAEEHRLSAKDSSVRERGGENYE